MASVKKPKLLKAPKMPKSKTPQSIAAYKKRLEEVKKKNAAKQAAYKKAIAELSKAEKLKDDIRNQRF